MPDHASRKGLVRLAGPLVASKTFAASPADAASPHQPALAQPLAVATRPGAAFHGDQRMFEHGPWEADA
jgi:hypothetical protein